MAHHIVKNRNGAGFTIIEMMIAVALLAILLALGLPNFAEMLRNSRVRAEAETISSALQLARSEAIRRNTGVRFGLLDSDPATIAASVPTVCAAATCANHWAVWAVTPAGREVIDSRRSAEGAGTTPGATAFISSISPSEVWFDSLGRATNLVANATIDIGTCPAASGGRCLRVVVSPAGGVRVCDPSVTAAGDSRACPA